MTLVSKVCPDSSKIRPGLSSVGPIYTLNEAYTISEAANRAGVTADVLRAWERRYRIVGPRRTSGGYRQYDEAAIRRVRAMRRLVDDGWTPSAAAESLRNVEDADLPEPDALPDESPWRRRRRPPLPFCPSGSRNGTGRPSGGSRRDGGSRSSELMVDRYLFPALHVCPGRDAWQAGAVSVAADTRRAPLSAGWIGAAYDAAGTNRPGARPILVGLPAGARHELGALAFAGQRHGVPALRCSTKC